MSALPARVQPRPQQKPAPTRTLRPVTTPGAKRRPKMAYAALAVGGAIAIGVAQMAISLAATQDAFVLAQLNNQQHELSLEKQALHDDLVGLSSPQALAKKADAMGLVVAGSASYLRLSDGQVLGAGQSADWISTIDPNGSSSVGNALLVPPPAEAATDTPSDSTAQDAATPTAPAAPPTVTDGLPSPTTR